MADYRQTTKKSGHPTQPGNRSTASRPHTKRKKRRTILQRIVRFFKILNWKGRIVVALLALIIALPFWVLFSRKDEPADADTMATATPAIEYTVEQPEDPEPAATEKEDFPRGDYIFQNGEGLPINWEELTTAWAAEAGFEKRYNLTDDERWIVASVVTGEAGAEPFAGKVAVAQCILQSCEDDGIRPDEAVVKYVYTPARPEPSEEALEAVQAVFDFGYVAATEPIKYFYAPALCESAWHESQNYVMTISGHRFFAENKEAT